jgi:hypothetical protein
LSTAAVDFGALKAVEVWGRLMFTTPRVTRDVGLGPEGTPAVDDETFFETARRVVLLGFVVVGGTRNGFERDFGA